MPLSIRYLAIAALVLARGLTAAESALSAALLPSTQYAHSDIFFRTPSGRGPALATAREIAPGQRLDLLVLVNGYAVDAEGKAHVTYELVIHYPGGKTQRLPDRVTVAEKLKVDPRSILFPANIPRFNTAAGDPAGYYRFEIVVRDQVSGATTTKSATVNVTDSAAPLPLPADFDTSRFIADYYQRARPRLALSALTAFSQTPHAQRKADGQGPQLGFYDQVLRDNPWLLPQFTQRLSAAIDPGELRMIALVLANAKRDEPKFGDDLSRPARNALAAARKESLPLPSREPTSGGQLDLEWGAFLASGRFEPIANLVAVVQNYLPHRGALEDYKKLPVKPKTPPPEVMKDIMLGSALWSLGSNARQHKLVRDYLVGIEQAKDTPPEVKAALQATLAWQPKEPAPGASPK